MFSWNKCEFHENRRSRCGDVIVDAGFLHDKAAVCRDTILRRRVKCFILIIKPTRGTNFSNLFLE